MQTISITEARKKLPELINKVYLSSQSFTITKGNIPMAKIIKADETANKKKYTAEEKRKAIKEAAGIWKDRWKGIPTEKVVDMLWEKGWKSHAT